MTTVSSGPDESDGERTSADLREDHRRALHELARVLLANGFVLIDEDGYGSEEDPIILFQKFAKEKMRVRISWERYIWEIGAFPSDPDPWNEGGGWAMIWQKYLDDSVTGWPELSTEEQCSFFVTHLQEIESAIEHDPRISSKLDALLRQFNEIRWQDQ